MNFGKYVVVVYRAGSAGTSSIITAKYATIYSVVEEHIVDTISFLEAELDFNERVPQPKWQFTPDSFRYTDNWSGEETVIEFDPHGYVSRSGNP